MSQKAFWESDETFLVSETGFLAGDEASLVIEKTF